MQMSTSFNARCLSVGIVGSLFLLTACSSQSGTPDPEGSPKAAARPTVKVMVANNAKFENGMNENKNPYIDYIRDNTNLDVQFTMAPNEGYQDRLNIVMASGDLPDIIHTADPTWLVNYVNQKALQPLNDVMEKYGQDLKKIIPEKAWANVTIDGKIYAIPSLREAQGDEIMYVRKDWLDKLGLKPPKTLDEYTAVMKAFVERDPDGNGKNDTLGLVISDVLGHTEPFFGAFGIQRGQWVARNGELKYSSTLPEAKQALQYLAGLFQQKLLDPEFPLTKTAIYDEKISKGQVGLFSGPWHYTRAGIKTNKENDPKANWVTLDYPVGPAGKSGTRGDNIVLSYAVVPATSKKVNEAVQLLNFVAGKGHRTLQLGFEGIVWQTKGGKTVTNFEEHNKSIYRGMYAMIANPATYRKERLDSLGPEFNLNDNVDKINAAAIYSDFLAIPTPAMGKYNNKLWKLESEVYSKIVMGVAPLDEFDKFVETWRKEGGSEMEKEANDWYKNYKK